jgi:transposase
VAPSGGRGAGGRGCARGGWPATRPTPAGRPVRSFLRRRGIGAVIPTQAREPGRPDFDREAYRQRNRVERLINRLKQFRRIATRYEKRAVNYLAMVTLAAVLLWL